MLPPGRVIDRDEGDWLAPMRHRGQDWIAGTPGHRYSVRLNNTSSERVLVVLSVDGVDHHIDATGDGPVDAAFNCVKMLFPHEARLQLYQVSAVTEGTDAQATVSVRMEEDGRIVTGSAADTDTILASVKAYVGALNRLRVRRGVVWHKEILVPRSRVQHLDIERGPIERHFGLATLVVHTAGTRLHALRQPGLLDADALALRDALLPEADRDDDTL